MLSTIGSSLYYYLPKRLTGAPTQNPGNTPPAETIRDYTPAEKEAILRADDIIKKIFSFSKPEDSEKPIYSAYCSVIYAQLHARPADSLSVTVTLPEVPLPLELEQLPPDRQASKELYSSVILTFGEKKDLLHNTSFRSLLERLNPASITKLFNPAEQVNQTALPSLPPDTQEADNEPDLAQSVLIQQISHEKLFSYFLAHVKQHASHRQERNHHIECDYKNGKFYDFTFAPNTKITISSTVKEHEANDFIIYHSDSKVPILAPLIISRWSGQHQLPKHTVLLVLFKNQIALIDPKSGFNLLNDVKSSVLNDPDNKISIIGLKWQSVDDGECSSNFTAEIFTQVLQHLRKNFGFIDNLPLDQQFNHLKLPENKPSLCHIDRKINTALKSFSVS